MHLRSPRRVSCRLRQSGLLALSVLITALFIRSASAETWVVAEGDRGTIHGVWTVSIEGRRFTGSAAMTTARGQPLTYRLAGSIRDGKVVASRIEPSDRTSCTYISEIGRATKLAGSAFCNGSSSPWQVARMGRR